MFPFRIVVFLCSIVCSAPAFSLSTAVVPHARCIRCRPVFAAEKDGGILSALNPLAQLQKGGKASSAGDSEAEGDEDSKMTIEKVASFGIAGILSIAVAESVFWILSFPTSELLYFVSTGEWIDLLTQEGQLKFLAFTAGWGAIGGVIAQYRTVLTAAAMTPWMDANVVKPYVNPVLAKFGQEPDK